MSPPRIFQRFKPAMAIKPTLDDAKKLLDISAGTNRNLFIAFNLVLVTALILVLGITDEQLLVGNTVIPLPFLNVPLPISAFATVVPLVVMAAHFDLLHNLNEHSRKLRAWVAAWEAKYPRDSEQTAVMNAAVSEQLFPFLYDFAWLHANGKGSERVNARLLPGMCWALYCWAPYTVLVIFFIRFADLQDYKYTGWHFLLILLDVAWLYWYWPRFGAKRVQNRVWRWVRKVVNLPWFLLGVSSLAGCWTLGLFYLIQMHLDFDGSAQTVKVVIEFEKRIHALGDIALVPRLVIVDYWIKLDPNHFKVAMLLEPDKKTEAEVWAKTALPLNLDGRRLGFAVFRNVVIPRVNFSGANLKAASLRDAKLQGADLRSAQLQGASFRSATIIGSNFANTALRTAILPEAGEFSGTIGQPDWNKFELLLPMLDAAWAKAMDSEQLGALKYKLTEAEKRTETFTKPILPPKNSQKFEQVWLATVCLNEATAKRMLRKRMLRQEDWGGKLPAEITDTALRNWLETHTECKPYQALAEAAIKERADSKSAKP